jgi:UDP-N-acetylglucosamine--N-acetylmuramyl-(pentapeptide) pyrophosphoryl-undecaprenol N-acetylglucosamine transferase
VLLVSRKGVDSKLSAKYSNLRFVRTPGVPMSMSPLRLLAFVFSQIHAIIFGLNLLRERTSAVMAFGGFTSLGIVVAARIRGVPVALHEANRNPGKAIRLLRRVARRIYLPDGIRLEGVPMPLVRYLGYPVRSEIRRGSRADARKALGFSPDGKLLAILGGSQGAASLNKWAIENARALCANGISICCICGPGNDTPQDFELPDNVGGVSKVRFIQFCDRMDLVLNAADLAVSRAGAGSIAEFVECVVPSILVPFPFAADNHQMANASHLERQGGCVVVEQDKLDGLLAEVLDLMFSDWLLERLCFNLTQARRPDCAARTAADLIELGGEAQKRR